MRNTLPNQTKKLHNKPHIIFVFGKSGAGLSTTCQALEEIGYYRIDNLPFEIFYEQLEKLLLYNRPLCVCLYHQSIGWTQNNFQKLQKLILEKTPGKYKVLFVTCEENVLLKRFSHLRRKPPLLYSSAMSLKDFIQLETEKLKFFENISDFIIDTSHLQEKETKALIHKHFMEKLDDYLIVQIFSFSYKVGLPYSSDLVFDARFLKNPFYINELKTLTGLDSKVKKYICSDRDFLPFIQKLQDIALFYIEQSLSEKKGYLTISIGCTGGQHRSVCVAEQLYKNLQDQKHQILLKHLNLKT